MRIAFLVCMSVSAACGEEPDPVLSDASYDAPDVEAGWMFEDAEISARDASGDAGQPCLDEARRVRLESSEGVTFARGAGRAVFMARRSDDYSTTTFSIVSAEDGMTQSSELVELPSLYVCDAYHDGERWHVVGTTPVGGVHVSMRESGIESIDAFDAPDFECERVLGGDGYVLALGFRRTDGETDRGRLQIVGVDLVSFEARSSWFEDEGARVLVLGRRGDSVMVHVSDEPSGEDPAFRAYAVRQNGEALEVTRIEPVTTPFRLGEFPFHVEDGLLAGMSKTCCLEISTEVFLEWTTPGERSVWSSMQAGTASLIGVFGELPRQRVLMNNTVEGDPQVLLGVIEAPGDLAGGLNAVANRSIGRHAWTPSRDEVSLVAERADAMEVTTWTCR